MQEEKNMDQGYFKMEFDSCSQNEQFARIVTSAYCTRLDPTLEEMSDLKTAVSEAVTNAVIHGYENGPGKIELSCRIKGFCIVVEVRDYGVGIADIEKAMEPMYTTRPEWERSGMGFAFMEAFTDELEVVSEPGKGTCVRMTKKIGG